MKPFPLFRNNFCSLFTRVNKTLSMPKFWGKIFYISFFSKEKCLDLEILSLNHFVQLGSPTFFLAKKKTIVQQLFAHFSNFQNKTFRMDHWLFPNVCVRSAKKTRAFCCKKKLPFGHIVLARAMFYVTDCHNYTLTDTVRFRDGWRYQNGWIFKIPNGLEPPLSFLEAYIAIFRKNPCSKLCINVQNLQHKFLDCNSTLARGVMKDSGCPRAMRGIAARVQPPRAQI